MLNPAIIAACQAGLRAAMEPSDPPVVPEEHQKYADEWMKEYNAHITAMRNQRPMAA